MAALGCMTYAAEGMGSLTQTAAVFSSDLVKEHSSYSAGGLATCQMDNSCRTCKMPVKEHTASYGGFESYGSGKVSPNAGEGHSCA